MPTTSRTRSPRLGAPLPQAELSGSTADWLIVIGNDPLWSAGASGPSPLLQTRLLPLLNTAGAALYVGGRDPLAQHFSPVPSAPAVDVIGIGNGAAGNASQAALLPGRAACPVDSLQFAYGAGAGFATLSFALPPAGGPSAAMTVTFYDQSGDALYAFTKNTTRAGRGRAAPPPAAGAHGARSGLLVLVLLAVAAGLGIWYFSRLASRPLEPDLEELRPRKAAAARPPPRPRTDEEGRPLLPRGAGVRSNTFTL